MSYKLSTKQQKWLKNYLSEGSVTYLNATESAKQAGYRWPNKLGHLIAKSPKIKPYIDNYLWRKFPKRQPEQINMSKVVRNISRNAQRVFRIECKE